MDGARGITPHGEQDNYLALFEQSPIPVALVSMQDEPRFVTASRGFLDTFDLRRPRIAGCALDDLLIAQGDEDLATAIHRGLATSDEIDIEVELRGGASRRLIRMLVHAAGGFTDHVVLEAGGRGHAVHSAAQRLPSLFEQAGAEGGSVTYVHDLRRGRLRYADGDLTRRLALPAGSMPFKDFATRVHPDDLAEHEAYEVSRDSLADDEFAAQAVRVRDRYGEWRLISLRSRVLRRGRDGAVRLLLGTAIDITDHAAAAVEAAGISVLRVEENERARIGRELHDSTSQHLVAADLGLARVLRGSELSADARERLRGVHDSLAMAQTEIRAFS